MAIRLPDGMIDDRNIFNGDIRTWRQLKAKEGKLMYAWQMAEQFFIKGDSLEDIQAATVIPLSFLLDHIRVHWRVKFDNGSYGSQCVVPVEKWDEYAKKTGRGPAAKPLTKQEIAIRTRYADNTETRILAQEFGLTCDQVRNIVKKQGGILRPVRGPALRELTDQEKAIRLDFSQRMGYRRLSRKYGVSIDRIRTVISKHGGVSRIPAIPQFNPKP